MQWLVEVAISTTTGSQAIWESGKRALEHGGAVLSIGVLINCINNNQRGLGDVGEGYQQAPETQVAMSEG